MGKNSTSARKQTSLSKRLSFIIIAMILISTVIVAIFSYVFYRNETIKLSGERALGVAITVAAAIEPDGFDRAMAEQKKDAQWDRIKDFADQTAV
ncbi:MAG: hypothetical protein LBN36_08445, partial [Clostridiales Family XIII bacterium]|nr:hypothetical protein [Clostridiales Family XIII bacterium]